MMFASNVWIRPPERKQIMLSKTSLQTTIKNLQEAQLRQSRDAYASYLAEARRDRTEPTDQDQASQELGNAELAEYFEAPTRTYEAALNRLQSIDFGPKSRVRRALPFRSTTAGTS